MIIEGCSDVGQVRGHNEDFWLADAELGLYVVCDGMGGHAAGEVASKITAETLQEMIAARRPSTIEEAKELIEYAVQEANRRVYHMGSSDQQQRGMGTTCTSMIVAEGKAVLAHVGDSRLYLLRNQEVHQLSTDHTFVAEALKAGIITKEQAKHSEHSNMVTRAIGPAPHVSVDTLVIDVLAGDTFLLCSDGLTQYVDEEEELATYLKEDKGIAERLVRTANERGGEDNITALVLRVPKSESEQVRASQVHADFSALKHIHLLSELDMIELTRVTSHLESIDYPEGREIVKQGEISGGLYIIAEGEVSVTRDAQPIATLPPGSHFGEMALLNHNPRSATVQAATHARLLRLSREGFNALIQQDQVIGVKILWRLAQTLSIRLDDAFEVEGNATRKTLRFGLYPSPFSDEPMDD